MARLAGWKKRIKLTIDSGDVTAALSNFPVLIFLSTASGITAKDVSSVFDEIGANSKKIAVTKNDGLTECYVEVEDWDNVGEEAWLWVKIPNIASGADTDIYLYYDNSHADNDTYIGLCADGSAATEAVWSNGFIAVYHLKDNTTSTILDSTSSDLDGTKTGANQPQEVAGKIGPAQEFDPDEDITLDGFGGPYTTMTLESWFQADDTDNERTMVFLNEVGGDIDRTSHNLGTDLLYNYWRTDGVTENPSIAWSDEVNWHYYATTRDGTATKGYPDGTLDAGLNGVVGVGPMDNLTECFIGSRRGIDFYFDGTMDEVRISNVARNAAWIKASYESGRDDFITFGDEEALDSENLLGIFTIRKASSEDLLGIFISRRAGSEDLLGIFTLRKSASEDLAAQFKAVEPALQELFGIFYVDDTHSITGITKDTAGARLGNCEVALFRVEAGVPPNYTFIEAGVSDGNGDYTFTGLTTRRFFVRAQKDGSPNVFDTTDNELEPV